MIKLKNYILFAVATTVSLFSHSQIVNSFDKSGFPIGTEFFVRQKDSMDLELEKLTQIKVDDYIIDLKNDQTKDRMSILLLFFNDSLVNLRFVSFKENNSLDVLNIDKKESGTEFLTYAIFNQDSVPRFSSRSDYLNMTRFDSSGISLNQIVAFRDQSISSASCTILTKLQDDEESVRPYLGDLKSINSSLVDYHINHLNQKGSKVIGLNEFNECNTYSFEIWLKDKEEGQILSLIENLKLEGQLPSVIVCYKHLFLSTNKSKYLSLYQKHMKEHYFLLETDPENYKIIFNPED